MQGNEKVLPLLARFETVEWLYDGLNGKVIPWTLEHGNTNHDPSVLAFVLQPDGTVVTRAPDAVPYQASSFARWLEEQADGYEKLHPRTRVPFVRSSVTRSGPTEEPTYACADLDRARADAKPVLLYFGREERPDLERAEKKQAKAARKFEKSTLDSKGAAKEADGWVLLRFDLGDGDQAAFARGLGVEAAPALVLFAPGAEAHEALPAHLSGASLAYHLKKHKAE